MPAASFSSVRAEPLTLSTHPSRRARKPSICVQGGRAAVKAPLQPLGALAHAGSVYLRQRQDAWLHPGDLHAAVDLVNHPLNQVQRQRLREWM